MDRVGEKKKKKALSTLQQSSFPMIQTWNEADLKRQRLEKGLLRQGVESHPCRESERQML